MNQAQLTLNARPPSFTNWGLVTDGDANSFAVFSKDRNYRYLLGRIWDGTVADGETRGKTLLLFIMCNPSKGDAFKPDPTITKCIGFAERKNCGGILIVNLAAWRATDPRELRGVTDIVGPSNEAMLHWALRRPNVLRVAAWGRLEKRTMVRVASSLAIVNALRESVGSEPYCLGLTTAEPLVPRHPLMLPYATPLTRLP